MKNILIMTALTIGTLGASAAPTATDVSPKCYVNAAKFTEKLAEKKYYDEDGFDAYACALADNKAVVICEIAASKGDGAATDTYRAVLNKSCTRAFRVELIGEE